MDDELSSFVGTMIGSAIGDAVGELKQRHPQLSLDEILELPLKYTDDTALSLAVAEAIIDSKNLTTKILGDHFLKTINADPSRGYGGLPVVYYTAELKFMSYLQARDRVNLALRNGEGSYGDGAAMRIAPAALYYRGSPGLMRKIRLICSIDHNHLVAIDSCAVVASLITSCVSRAITSDQDILKTLTALCRSQAMRTCLDTTARALNEGLSCREVDGLLGNTSRSNTDSPPVVSYAIYCFLRNRDSFEGCLEDSISTQGDADTIAAIACAISGAFLGIGNIPPKFRSNLEDSRHIEEAARSLFRKRQLQGGA